MLKWFKLILFIRKCRKEYGTYKFSVLTTTSEVIISPVNNKTEEVMTEIMRIKYYG